MRMSSSTGFYGFEWLWIDLKWPFFVEDRETLGEPGDCCCQDFLTDAEHDLSQVARWSWRLQRWGLTVVGHSKEDRRSPLTIWHYIWFDNKNLGRHLRPANWSTVWKHRSTSRCCFRGLKLMGGWSGFHQSGHMCVPFCPCMHPYAISPQLYNYIIYYNMIFHDIPRFHGCRYPSTALPSGSGPVSRSWHCGERRLLSSDLPRREPWMSADDGAGHGMAACHMLVPRHWKRWFV